MKSQRKSLQHGVSFFGLISYAIVFAVAGVIAAQVLPTAMEYMAINKAVQKASEGPSAAEARLLFDKSASINDIKSIGGKDLEITKEGEKMVVGFAYEREIHLAGPAYLTLKYAGRSK